MIWSNSVRFFSSLLLLVIFCFASCSSAQTESNGIIHSYEQCVAAGFPIMRSLPPKCASGDGKVFVKGDDGMNFQPESERRESGGRSSTCKDLCGNGKCEQMVCMAVGCPCAETPKSCPKDCGAQF